MRQRARNTHGIFSGPIGIFNRKIAWYTFVSPSNNQKSKDQD